MRNEMDPEVRAGLTMLAATAAAVVVVLAIRHAEKRRTECEPCKEAEEAEKPQTEADRGFLRARKMRRLERQVEEGEIA